MKNLKFILLIAAGLLILGVGLYATIATIVGEIERSAKETAPETETETEAEAEIRFEEIEPDIVFEMIETEPEQVETESAESETVVYSASYDQVNEVNTGGSFEVCEAEYASYDQVNESDVMLLAKVIQNEAGADIATDEHQRAVASVVINRVADPRFPHDNIYDIIMCGWYDGHTLQYNFGTLDAFYSIVPSERAIANAEYVLTHGSTIPADCVWQDNSIQGEVVMTFDYPGFRTTYICR
jgi:FlaG/FlaF family flagellin (archaellin)